ncbi:unnamed protein product [Tetraodon nigroviridis]|uniref:(spotted green pufferfish) hypothetical protein n=1 Tax=Tetraodon nigroviridis TaxID=99883 RepID=Q4RUP9_TETNG|nr:unnamed protein product [Tetraodon nigroviridis]
MALSVIVPLLALASLCAAFAPSCDDMVKPYIPLDPKAVFGKWVYVMGAGDPDPYHRALGSIKSSWVELSPTSDVQTVTLRWGDYLFNQCALGEVNATLSGTTVTFQKNLSEHRGHLLQTRANSLLWTDSFRNVDVTGRFVMQFTRTGTTDPELVRLFKEQIACLHFPENFHSYDGTTELCPEASPE